MNQIDKHKRKVIISLAIFIVLVLATIFMIIASASTFKQQWNVLSLLLIILVEIPVVVSTVLSSLNLINVLLEDVNSNRIIQNAELDNYEKEVEEKAKEAEDLTFNLNRLTSDVGKHNNWEDFGIALLKGICQQLEVVTGMVYQLYSNTDTFKCVATYAYYSDNKPIDFKIGEGLSGQVAKDNKAIFVTEIPEGYIDVVSGLGKCKPSHLAILPIYKNGKVVGIIELATFKKIGDSFVRRVEEIAENFGNLAPLV